MRSRLTTTVAVPKKSILNLGVNCVEPLLRSVGPLSIGRAFRFQFCNPIFGCAELIGKLLSHAQRETAILFSNAGGLVYQLQYRLSALSSWLTSLGTFLGVGTNRMSSVP